MINLTLSITDKCNLECQYCFSKRKSLREDIDDDKVIKFIDIQDRKYIRFHFYGGEPTINNNLIYFIKKLKELYKERIYIRVTTNLMRSKNFFQSLPNYVKILATYHTDSVKKSKEWFDKALVLYHSKQLVGLNIMIQENNMDYILSLYNKYKKQLPILKLDPIDQIKFTDKYLKFRKENKYDEHNVFGWFKNEDVEIIVDGKKQNVIPDCYTFGAFKGMICVCGFDIYENGDVKWCDGEKIPLLNLHTDTIEKYPRFHLCKNDECPGDTEFGKYSIRYFLKNKKGLIW